MKKLFFVLVLSFMVLQLGALELNVNQKGFSLESDNMTFACDYQRFSFFYRTIEYGDIGRRGLIRTLYDVHSYDEFIVKADRWRKTDVLKGLVASVDSISLFILPSPRFGAGISIYKDNLSMFYLYMDRARVEEKSFNNTYGAIDKSVMYWGFKYRYSWLGLISIVSLDSYGNYQGFISTRFEYNPFWLDIRIGNIFPIRERNVYDIFSLNIGIKRDCFDIEWKVNIGNKPIYSYEYRTKSSRKRISLSIGKMKAEIESVILFSDKGISKSRYSFALISHILNLHYDNKKGFSYRVFIDKCELFIASGTVEVKIPLAFIKDRWSVEVLFGNKVGVGINAKLIL